MGDAGRDIPHRRGCVAHAQYGTGRHDALQGVAVALLAFAVGGRQARGPCIIDLPAALQFHALDRHFAGVGRHRVVARIQHRAGRGGAEAAGYGLHQVGVFDEVLVTVAEHRQAELRAIGAPAVAELEIQALFRLQVRIGHGVVEQQRLAVLRVDHLRRTGRRIHVRHGRRTEAASHLRPQRMVGQEAILDAGLPTRRSEAHIAHGAGAIHEGGIHLRRIVVPVIACAGTEGQPFVQQLHAVAQVQVPGGHIGLGYLARIDLHRGDGAGGIPARIDGGEIDVALLPGQAVDHIMARACGGKHLAEVGRGTVQGLLGRAVLAAQARRGAAGTAAAGHDRGDATAVSDLAVHLRIQRIEQRGVGAPLVAHPVAVTVVGVMAFARQITRRIDTRQVVHVVGGAAALVEEAQRVGVVQLQVELAEQVVARAVDRVRRAAADPDAVVRGVVPRLGFMTFAAGVDQHRFDDAGAVGEGQRAHGFVVGTGVSRLEAEVGVVAGGLEVIGRVLGGEHHRATERTAAGADRVGALDHGQALERVDVHIAAATAEELIGTRGFH